MDAAQQVMSQLLFHSYLLFEGTSCCPFSKGLSGDFENMGLFLTIKIFTFLDLDSYQEQQGTEMGG
jgi:hypothetical protein